MLYTYLSIDIIYLSIDTNISTCVLYINRIHLGDISIFLYISISLPISKYIYIPMYLYLYLYVYISLPLSLCLYIYIYISISVSLYKALLWKTNSHQALVLLCQDVSCFQQQHLWLIRLNFRMGLKIVSFWSLWWCSVFQELLSVSASTLILQNNQPRRGGKVSDRCSHWQWFGLLLTLSTERPLSYSPFFPPPHTSFWKMNFSFNFWICTVNI